jgi:hypothetical protein
MARPSPSGAKVLELVSSTDHGQWIPGIMNHVAEENIYKVLFILVLGSHTQISRQLMVKFDQARIR